MKHLTSALILACVASLTSAYNFNQIMKGDTSTLYTTTEYNYNSFWLETYIRDHLIFRVRACSDVHVLLVQERRDITFNVTEIVIGGWYNTRSVIRNFTNFISNGAIGMVYADVNTPDIMHCTDYRTFWIQWGSSIRVGVGPIVGEQVFMVDYRTREIAGFVQFVGFSTGYGVSGMWKLQENQGQYLVVLTPDDYKYQYMWKTTEYKSNHLRFRVQSCNDMHIMLTPTEGVTHYEVVLAGYSNTRSDIRIKTQVVDHLIESGVGQCDVMQMFWILWEGGHIRVGRGADLGRNQMMSYRDPAFPGINHLSISTGWGAAAVWAFNDDLENVYRYFLHSEGSLSPQYHVFVETSRLDFVVFEVEACSDVWIALTNVPRVADQADEHLYIGSQNNTRTGVKFGNATISMVEVPTPGILSCLGPRWFWVSWFNGTGRFGQGNLVGYNETMNWGNVTVRGRVISSVGFGITREEGGFFLARRNMADRLVVITPPSEFRRMLWTSVNQDVIYFFSVLSCHSVHLTLSGVIDMPDTQTYEVVLGNCYQTVVRDRFGPGNESVNIASVNSSDLSCFEFRSYWVSWIGGFVRVGRGHRHRVGQIIALPQAKPHPITAISLSTVGVRGEFVIEGDQGDYIVSSNMPGDSTFTWFQLLFPRLEWFYFDVLGVAAHLVLGSRYQDPLDVYNIYIGANLNTECALWKGTTLLQRRTVPNMLSFEDMRSFHVSWVMGRIHLRTGRHPALGFLLLNHTDDYPFNVTAFALTGDRGAVAEWRIQETFAREMTITTTSRQFYDHAWRSVRHRQFLVFGLQTCGHAEIVLSAIMHDLTSANHFYTVVVSTVTNRTEIWRGNRNTARPDRLLTSAPTPEHRMCDTEHHHWLSWFDGHIALGRGQQRGARTIVSYQDLDVINIHAIAFATINYTGTWRTPLTVDDFTQVPRPRNPNSLTGGETAGVFFGSLFIIVLFGIMLLYLLAPATASAILSRVRSRLPGAAAEQTSFENPVVTEFPEVSLS